MVEPSTGSTPLAARAVSSLLLLLTTPSGTTWTLTVTVDTAVLDVDGNQVMSDTGFSPQTLEVSSMAVGGAPSDVIPDSTGTLQSG